jgi:zinc/manganese transport system substrate-binding protein
MRKHSILTAVAVLLSGPVLAQTGAARAGGQLAIVAAENFYGDVAGQLSGPAGAVTSILSNPDEDPHLFEASPSVARALSAARIVVYNGADYDPWMAKLLKAARSPDRLVIVVADLVHRKTGDNPHLWYDTANMAEAAKAISAALVGADRAGEAGYRQRLEAFVVSLKAVDARVASMRARYAGVQVAAIEPVFGYMAAALGLKMRNERFQLAVMNNTEPRASDVAAFEADLRKRQIHVLLYNSQASNTAAKRLLGIAGEVGVPVVGVTETEPGGKTYQAWMMDQLDALDAALGRFAP